MDKSMGIIFLVIFLILAALFYAVWRNYQKMNRVLNQAHNLNGNAEGTVKELVTVYRRNRSFRWKNEYPVIAYNVNGQTYETALAFAEKRAGSYDMNGHYTVCYLPEDPTVCIVEEFRSKMQSNTKQKLVGMVVLVFFMINMLFAAITSFV